jgi:hypothetical protein
LSAGRAICGNDEESADSLSIASEGVADRRLYRFGERFCLLSRLDLNRRIDCNPIGREWKLGYTKI